MKLQSSLLLLALPCFLAGLAACTTTRIVEEQDVRLRNDFLTNSGLDRFQVEELETEYFEMRAFPPQLLEVLRTQP